MRRRPRDTPVAAAPPGLDLAALARHLECEVAGGSGRPWSATLLPGGRSNLTYLVSDGRRRFVLRRPPLGHVLATAHDMTREFRVLTALSGSDVPVPRPLALCEDPLVLGAPFYVMEYVDGVVYRAYHQLAALDGTRAAALADALVDTLAGLHRLDYAAVGLDGLGRPDGYLERQLRRWRGQLAASRSREVPGIEELAHRLTTTRPPSGWSALVHGDYRLDNVIVDAADPGVVRAVLDWEMATLGDPLTDLAALVMFWDGLPGAADVIAASPGGHPAFPGRGRLLDRYAHATGADLSSLPWYLAFAHYKLAVILEGIHYRAGAGLTVGSGFDRIGALVPLVVERGLAALCD